VIRLEAYPAAVPSWRLSRADALARAGDHSRAAAEADDLSRPASLPGLTLYNLACVQALNAASRPLPLRAKDADGYAAKAVDLLRRAANAGYFKNAKTLAHLHQDTDLDVLRERPDYQAFAATLKR
jgi:hypothetical protein